VPSNLWSRPSRSSRRTRGASATWPSSIRNSAGGVTVLVALFFVLSIASGFLSLVPGEFWKYVPQYIPSEAGGRFLSIGHTDGVIDPWQGGLIFLGYVLVFLIPAMIVIKKRDV